MEDLEPYDDRYWVFLLASDYDALLAERNDLLEALANLVSRTEREIDTRKCSPATLRALNTGRAILHNAAAKPAGSRDEGPEVSEATTA